MQAFEVKFSLKDQEYMTALRLVGGAVCSLGDVDVDTGDDFKVCITESVLLMKHLGYEKVKVTFQVEGGVSAKVEGEHCIEQGEENELSLALIEALMPSTTIQREAGVIQTIELKL